VSEQAEKVIDALERWLDARAFYHSDDNEGQRAWAEVERERRTLSQTLDEFLSFTPILSEDRES
jgi:hypothetical protein